VLALAGALGLVSCASGGTDWVSATAEKAPYVAERTLGGSDLGATIGVARDIPELLPNRRFVLPGGNAVANSQSVVVGRPVDVEPETATVWEADLETEANPDGARTVEFDDASAQGRTWLVTVAVDETIAGLEPSEALRGAADDSVTVRFRSAGGAVDIDGFRSSLLGIGRSVWFLTAYADAPTDAFGVAWNGGAVATIDQEGALAFPFLAPSRRLEIEEESFTVERLRQLGTEPDVRIATEEVPP